MSHEYELSRAVNELEMLERDCEVFGETAEDIERMNLLRTYISELITNPTP
jgi:replication initiation and membrane attachment protein DnaB